MSYHAQTTQHSEWFIHVLRIGATEPASPATREICKRCRTLKVTACGTAAKRVKSAERTKLTKQIKRTKRKQGEATNRQRQTDYRSERQRTHVGTNLRAEQLPGIVRLRCSHSWQVSPYDSGGRFRRLVGGGRFGFSVGPGPPRARRAAESCR